MKRRFFYFIFLVSIVLSLLVIPSHAMAYDYSGSLCDLADDLPPQVQVTISDPPRLAGDDHYFEQSIIVTDIATEGIDLDGPYSGWCLDPDVSIGIGPLYNYIADVFLSYCDPLPAGLLENPDNLGKVNYILNQYYVGEASDCNGAYTYGDVQVAIWLLIDGDTGLGYGLGDWSQCRVDEILEDADDKGEFEPGCGDIVMVILVPEGGRQLLGITLPLECENGNEGLTPGFWKNHTDLWPDDYDPEDSVGDVFDIPIPGDLEELADDTLLDALKYKGGKGDIGMARILLQQAVAALLNASHVDINYPMAVEDIIADVNSALASGDRDTMEDLKDTLDEYNNLGGGIDAHGNPI